MYIISRIAYLGNQCKEKFKLTEDVKEWCSYKHYTLMLQSPHAYIIYNILKGLFKHIFFLL